MASAFRTFRLNESSPSSQQHPLLRDSLEDDYDASIYSDELCAQKVEPPSNPLSRSSSRISQSPVTDSFSTSSSARRLSRKLYRRLTSLIPRIFKTIRWRCSSSPTTHGSLLGFDSTFSQRPKPVQRVICVCVGILVMLGIIQLLALIISFLSAIFPDHIHSIIEHWGEPGMQGEGLDHYPTDFTRDIVPIGCHSHNDYWRKVPLFSAISAGCIGVEADVWLFDEELYVGHTTSSLTLNRTLRNLYINPLLDILDGQNPTHRFHPNKSTPLNGVYDTDASQTLSLLIDFKTSGPSTFEQVSAQLEPLRQRGYLTHFNGSMTVPGPLTVVATGNAPFDSVIRNITYRDIFFDAPLDEMSASGRKWIEMDRLSDIEIEYQHEAAVQSSRNDTAQHGGFRSRFIPQDQGQGQSGRIEDMNPDVYSPQNSYFASVALSKAVGHLWRRKLSSQQINLIRAQIRGAHRRGLKARYWGLPQWPIGLRNQVWEILVEEGVDLLNVDDLASASKKDWKKWRSWWGGQELDHFI